MLNITTRAFMGLDTENPNAAKRKRPLMGLQVMVGMRRVGTDQWTGQLYNADDGKTYTGTLVLTGANSLKVEGCVTGPECVVVCPLVPPPSPERIRRTAIVTANRKSAGAA